MDDDDRLLVNSKPKWEWIKINCLFKAHPDQKEICFSLKPQLAFYFPDDSGSENKLQIKMNIDTQRSPSYSNEVGWAWHKSRNFPSISLKVNLLNTSTNQSYPLPQAKAYLFAAKFVGNNLEEGEYFLQHVGTIGENQIEIKEGVAVFDKIRFETTSYINQGVKIHLVLFIALEGELQQIKDVVCSAISPPMFIDSRKFAREYHEKKLCSFMNSFEPKMFSRNFVFNKNDEQSEQILREGIQNSIEGLYKYLVATNIRHKIKHPIYLSVKFSNVFHIMANTSNKLLQQQNLTLPNVLLRLQKILVSQIQSKRKSKKKNMIRKSKQFLITVIGHCSSFMKNKIYQCLDPLSCKSIQVARYNCQINSQYCNIQTLGNVQKEYSKNYRKILEISKRKNWKLLQQSESDLKQLIQSQKEQEQIQQQVLGKQSNKIKNGEVQKGTERKQSQKITKEDQNSQAKWRKAQQEQISIKKRVRRKQGYESQIKLQKREIYTPIMKQQKQFFVECEQQLERLKIIQDRSFMIGSTQISNRNVASNILWSNFSKKKLNCGKQNEKGEGQVSLQLQSFKEYMQSVKNKLVSEIELQNMMLFKLIEKNMEIKQEILRENR